MKKTIFLIVLMLIFPILCVCAKELSAGISMIDKVPDALYGTWRVKSQLTYTNSESTFKKNNLDLWNLSRVGDVIKLDNPFSGAKASIVLDSVEDKVIKFKKVGDYDSKKLTDIVQLTLGKESFTGENTLILDTVSELDGHLMKREKAVYKLYGEKISGTNIK